MPTPLCADACRGKAPPRHWLPGTGCMASPEPRGLPALLGPPGALSWLRALLGLAPAQIQLPVPALA